MKPWKVLIIDDEPLLRKTTAMLLQHLKMDARCAGSGPEGIEMAKNDNPDVILLDLAMPIMDGWAVLAHLKSDRVLSRIPVVLFTGDSFSFPPRSAKEKGVAAIMNKPFEPSELLSTLEGIFAGSPLL